MSPNSILGSNPVVEATLSPHVAFYRPKKLNFVVGTQLSGPPHFGTVLTHAITFVLAKFTKEAFGIETSVEIGFLDNTTALTIDAGGTTYQKNLAQTLSHDKLEQLVSDLYDSLHLYLSARTRVEYKRTVFSGLLSSTEIRRKLSDSLSKWSELINVFKATTLRVPCPVCGFFEKESSTTHHLGGGFVRSICFEHGEYVSDLNDPLETPYFDIGVLHRNLIKEVLLDCSESIVIKGTDWLPGCQTVDFGHRVLGTTPPTRVFTPLVVMESGAKLSKSFLRANGHISHAIPRWLRESDEITTEMFDFLFEFVECIMDDARHFYRSYTTSEMDLMLKKHQKG